MILLLAPRQNPSSTAIEKAALESSWEVRRLQNWRAPEELIGQRDVVAYGEPLFVAAIADVLDYYLIEPPFNWLPSLPYDFVKRDVELTTLSQARLLTNEIFAKPADDKCFGAAVYENGPAINASALLSPDTPLLISEVVTWLAEYRFFVFEAKIAASSIYAINGELLTEPGNNNADSKEAEKFVQSILSERLPFPPAAVLDVGKIADRGWAVVEANPAFGAGIYFCDARKVLPVLARSLVPASTASDDDRKWVLTRQVLT